MKGSLTRPHSLQSSALIGIRKMEHDFGIPLYKILKAMNIAPVVTSKAATLMEAQVEFRDSPMNSAAREAASVRINEFLLIEVENASTRGTLKAVYGMCHSDTPAEKAAIVKLVSFYRKGYKKGFESNLATGIKNTEYYTGIPKFKILRALDLCPEITSVSATLEEALIEFRDNTDRSVQEAAAFRVNKFLLIEIKKTKNPEMLKEFYGLAHSNSSAEKEAIVKMATFC
jgi:hypothetical protein